MWLASLGWDDLVVAYPTVDRAALSFSPLDLTAANKTIELSNFTFNSPTPALTLTVTNGANSYGLLISNNQAFAAAGGAPTFSVGTATASDVVQGFTLSGVISGGQTGAANVVFTKSGAGAMVLTNAGNTFGGTGSIPLPRRGNSTCTA